MPLPLSPPRYQIGLGPLDWARSGIKSVNQSRRTTTLTIISQRVFHRRETTEPREYPKMPPKQRHNNRKGKPNAPTITETTRIRISETLERFRASSDQVCTFDVDLSNLERAVVHQLCRKMGMTSKSSGGGTRRRVSVYKTKKTVDSNKKKDNLVHFNFSDESTRPLQELFACYPPGDEEFSVKAKGENSGKGGKVQRKKDGMFSKPFMSKAEIVLQVEMLASRTREAAALKQILKDRSKLPIASFKDVITSTIEQHQVVLISGETGCGKTTQVPQYLLDYMWGRCEACKIVCTQPRRISATSVAERISCERGEAVGDNVGYKIRLESKGGRNSSIVFCTNGVLLRLLVSQESDLRGITHIIVDEIHERDRYSDFILAILRDLLPSYPNLRLVLMSATLDAERFSHYFGGCPVIRVPGFTHPVKTFFLEDALSFIHSKDSNHLHSAMDGMSSDLHALVEEDKSSLEEAIDLAWENDEFDPLLEFVSSEGIPHVYDYQHSSSGLTPLMVFAGKGRVADVCMLLSFGANCHLQAKDGLTALDLAERENMHETADVLRRHGERGSLDPVEQQKLLDKYLATANPEFIDVVLIEQLIRKICTDSKDCGAILVFLPGWDDINKTRERLSSMPFFKDSSKFVILSLHSMVPSAEQKRVFKRHPPGCRKIILSTNIAETAITIDDVVYVIDSGRMKEKSYDPYNNVTTLQSSWISKASAKQREGRAGRCQPGICYHLYSKIRAASLRDFQVPEIRRMSVEELCLQVKILDPKCRIEDYLLKTLDPPVSEAIHNAIAILQDIGALSAEEHLTDLGEKLGSLPVHPRTSKMLFFAILVNCLDPALTLACAADYKDPFTLPMLPIEKKKANAAKAELAAFYGGHSDQLAVISAFECWKKAKEKGREAWFCAQYFVSSSTMHMLHGMRRQLLAELTRNGFIPENASSCSLNAQDPGIIRAVVVAGLYPMVGRFLPIRNGKRSTVETASGAKVRLHPHSLNFNTLSRETVGFPMVVYDEVSRGDGGMHIRNCTVVGPLPLLLLSTEIAVVAEKDDDDDNVHEEAGDGDDDDIAYDDSDDALDKMDMDEDELESDHKRGGGDRCEQIMSSPDNEVKVVVDRWLYFALSALDIAQIYCLRERLSAAILFKVTYPGKALPLALETSVFTAARILSYDGLSGIFKLAEPVDSLASLFHDTSINYYPRPRRRYGSDRANVPHSSSTSHAKQQATPPSSNRARMPETTNGVQRATQTQRGNSSSQRPRGGDSLKRQRGNASQR